MSEFVNSATEAQIRLHAAMTGSLNWREPEADTDIITRNRARDSLSSPAIAALSCVLAVVIIVALAAMCMEIGA